MSFSVSQAAEILSQAGIDAPVREANMLLAQLLGLSRECLMMQPVGELSPAQRTAFDALIARRAAHEPMSHLLGRREFYGREFIVTPDVLDPRPDTETLVETVLSLLPPFGGAGLHMLDLGTGSGCILLTLLAEVSHASGVGVDISEKALQVARKNAEKLGLSDRVEFRQGDWCEPAAHQQFDLIMSNPPYISEAQMSALMPEVADYEPHLALQGGKEGLDSYQKIAINVASLLKSDGILAVEIGHNQRKQVAHIFTSADVTLMRAVTDLAGHDRCLLFQKHQ